MTAITAWHLAVVDQDGNPICKYNNVPIVEGDILHANGAIEMAKNGLHASKRIWDALWHQHGPVISKVKLSGKVLETHGQLCAESRRHIHVLSEQQSNKVFDTFARECAGKVVYLWNCPEITKEFLLTGDPGLRAAANMESKLLWKVLAAEGAKTGNHTAASACGAAVSASSTFSPVLRAFKAGTAMVAAYERTNLTSEIEALREQMLLDLLEEASPKEVVQNRISFVKRLSNLLVTVKTLLGNFLERLYKRTC